MLRNVCRLGQTVVTNLKRCAEVTKVMQVDDSTRYLDKDGKTIKLANSRAGDTVYIVPAQIGEGQVARIIREGPMTVEELHRRYLNRKN